MSLITNEIFNWDIYEDGYTGSTKLIPNKSINGNDLKNKCFSRESYAQHLFDIYTNQDTDLIKKDFNKGDCIKIIDIYNIKDTFIDAQLAGGLTVSVDIEKEKKFIQVFGFNNVKDFTATLKNKDYLQQLLKKGINAFIIESTPSVKISLWQGHLKAVRDEFICQINNPTEAYKAKIIEANKGGFFVEVQGIEAFMPGSLAAANKIVDFQSYIGKEVVVMIEDFIKEMNSFIVSHKKYLVHILPSKIAELSLMDKYAGVITGVSKYGIFIEFNELFTGLLHISKMDEVTKKIFSERLIKAGNSIEFYIAEITKDRRIILTNENPENKLKKFQEFILNSKDKIFKSSVAAIMNFGIIVSINDLSGLIPISEFKKNKVMMNNYIVGEKINVIFDKFENEKLVFKLVNIKEVS